MLNLTCAISILTMCYDFQLWYILFDSIISIGKFVIYEKDNSFNYNSIWFTVIVL